MSEANAGPIPYPDEASLEDPASNPVETSEERLAEEQGFHRGPRAYEHLQSLRNADASEASAPVEPAPVLGRVSRPIGKNYIERGIPRVKELRSQMQQIVPPDERAARARLEELQRRARLPRQEDQETNQTS